MYRCVCESSFLPPHTYANIIYLRVLFCLVFLNYVLPRFILNDIFWKIKKLDKMIQSDVFFSLHHPLTLSGAIILLSNCFYNFVPVSY